MAMNVAVFHPGTQHSWQTARALQELGRLEWYATSIFYQPDRWPYRLERLPTPIGPRLRREFRRFDAPGLDPALVRTSGSDEWLERMARRAGWNRMATWFDQRGNTRFGRALRREIATSARFALWGYNASSRAAFSAARERGRTLILDRTIGDWRAYNQAMAMLHDSYGDWFTIVSADVSPAMIELEAEEHALADRILVGSEFAARTVRAFAETPAVADKVEVLEYCFDDLLFAGLPRPQEADRAAPVRFLFMGQGLPRKGFHHVLEAMAQFSARDAQLTVVGGIGISPGMFARHAERIRHHPPVARADVPAIMAAHDVLLFPSYFEGAGLVLYEALAAGLGVIQSDRAAIAVTPDTGILLDTLSTEALVEAMRRPIVDRALLDHWRSNAQDTAAQYGFAGYRDRVAALLNRVGV
jgi:glycosyltransferase involved in cell wall biosynthesis